MGTGAGQVKQRAAASSAGWDAECGEPADLVAGADMAGRGGAGGKQPGVSVKLAAPVAEVRVALMDRERTERVGQLQRCDPDGQGDQPPDRQAEDKGRGSR